MPFINLYRQFRWPMLLDLKRYISVLLFIAIVLSAVYLGRPDLSSVQAPSSVYLEDLTWREVKSAVDQGSTMVIVPTGGTEQNGPHVVLGKHNYIVKYTAGKVAEQLGHALVAPVISYVPEGAIDPPEGHMRFPGTISISEEAFESVLESTARSLKQHGFKLIAFIGDSGGNQRAQQRTAEKLNRLWQNDGVKLIHVSDYYANNAQTEFLLNNGLTIRQIGSHAGIKDTSELFAVFPNGVRKNLAVDYTMVDFLTVGANGAADRASSLLGRQLLNLKIEAAISQIRNADGQESMGVE